MIVRFQNLNSTSKPKGDLFQTKKTLGRADRTEEGKTDEAKRSKLKLYILKKGKVCYSLPLPFFLLLYFDVISNIS